MALSVLDMFSIGLGPSSSHTVGPMRAAAQFINGLNADTLAATTRAKVELFGSLGATGIGHHSDTAVILGLAGHDPATIEPIRLQGSSTRSNPPPPCNWPGPRPLILIEHTTSSCICRNPYRATPTV